MAIDIGASSGRHILGHVEDGKLILEEIHRFKNGAYNKNGTLVWDSDRLFADIIEGLKKCSDINKIPYSIGVDTWGVDYALLDCNDKLIEDVISYRDLRMSSVVEKVHKILSFEELYSKTGIQEHVFNTIYQLYDDKLSGRLKDAKTFLMMPDYIHFLLTGVKTNEFTNASTTGLLNVYSKDWDYGLIEKLGLPKQIFSDLVMPGSVIGEFTEDIRKKVGFNAIVTAPATHDTASAVMAVPKIEGSPLYISSGTWSLIGTETLKPYTEPSASYAGYTNEGGYGKTVRLLKNIMGLWMIQCVKKEYNDKYSFSEFVDKARVVKNFNSVVDVNDSVFFSPDSMIDEIKKYCLKTEQKVPETIGEIVLCIYESLARGYKKAVNDLENIIGVRFEEINVVGGGCQNDLLNELTAKRTGEKVVAGPVEATAIGNIISQMISEGLLKNLCDGRNLVTKSFDIREFS